MEDQRRILGSIEFRRTDFKCEKVPDSHIEDPDSCRAVAMERVLFLYAKVEPGCMNTISMDIPIHHLDYYEEVIAEVFQHQPMMRPCSTEGLVTVYFFFIK